MSDELFEDRRKALENEFFARENERLLAELREKREVEQERSELAAASGVTDAQFLEPLLAQGIRAESFVALTVAPLVAVGWADGRMRHIESSAVLEAASRFGIEKSGPAFDLLKSWLEKEPPARLLDLWCDYAGALAAKLDASARDALRDRLLESAREVARAAGGVLGLGSKTSPEEQAVIERIERVFDA